MEEITEISGLPLTAEFAAFGREEGVRLHHHHHHHRYMDVIWPLCGRYVDITWPLCGRGGLADGHAALSVSPCCCGVAVWGRFDH